MGDGGWGFAKLVIEKFGNRVIGKAKPEHLPRRHGGTEKNKPRLTTKAIKEHKGSKRIDGAD
jgi:hypothetical protein